MYTGIALPYLANSHIKYLLINVSLLDLREVCNELGSVRHKSFNIGVELGTPPYKLDEFVDECDDPLAAVIDYWLRGNAEKGLPISWQSIVAALRSPLVNEDGLASAIEQKYCIKSPTKGEQRLRDVYS